MGFSWIHLAQDMVKWQTLVSAIIYLHVSRMTVNFLNNRLLLICYKIRLLSMVFFNFQ